MGSAGRGAVAGGRAGGLLGYGRYRAVQAWKQILARSGATITHETNGITWSQAVRGKTIFTLHAKRAIPHGEGKYTLEDGMLLLYGPHGQPTDGSTERTLTTTRSWAWRTQRVRSIWTLSRRRR